MRGVILVGLIACGGGGPPRDLASAIASVVPDEARVVVGIGELHTRRDGPAVGSALAAFTRALPALGDRISDLVVETWVPEKCGIAAEATARIEKAVLRREETKSEVGDLAQTARSLGIQPRAMALTCDDYQALAPAGAEPDPAALLTFTTRELTRVTKAAVAAPASARPWVVVYGGALHNDRFPAKGVEEWSYVAAVEEVAKVVEIDVIVPELAEADPASRQQPWFSLVKDRHDIAVYQRGERSFVIVLPRS